MYQFHQIHTEICVALTRSNLIVRIDGFVTNLKKKMVIAFKKGWLFMIFLLS